MLANRKFSSALEQSHPDLHWRLMEFIEDYSLGDKPALVWQWRPVNPVEIEVAAPAVHDLMSRGAVSSRAQRGGTVSGRATASPTSPRA